MYDNNSYCYHNIVLLVIKYIDWIKLKVHFFIKISIFLNHAADAFEILYSHSFGF